MPAKKLAGLLADDRATTERVGGLPGLALIVLEIVVDHGGETSFPTLVREARERVGATEDEVEGALLALGRAALAFSVAVGYRDERYVAVLDLAAEAIAREVRGLTLPEPPAATISWPRSRPSHTCPCASARTGAPTPPR